MIKKRHVGRGNQKRKSWRAQKGNLKEEEECWRRKMRDGVKEKKKGDKVEEGCKRNQELSVNMDVNSFSGAHSQRKNTGLNLEGKKSMSLNLYWKLQ